jgi:outer membrane protein assembly factor BamB
MGGGYSTCIAATFKGVPMIIQGTGSGIVGVDARSGAALFTNDWCKGNVANCPNAAYEDGYVFWANGYQKGGICLKLTAVGTQVSAEQVWTSKEFDCHHGGYIIDNGYIYGNAGGGVACLDLKTGQKKWSAGGVGKGSVVWADGMLYLFSENGGRAGLATCSPTGLEMKGQFSVEGKRESWAHPAVIGGRLYLRYDTNLYCFDVKAK